MGGNEKQAEPINRVPIWPLHGLKVRTVNGYVPLQSLLSLQNCGAIVTLSINLGNFALTWSNIALTLFCIIFRFGNSKGKCPEELNALG